MPAWASQDPLTVSLLEELKTSTDEEGWWNDRPERHRTAW